MTSKKGEKYYTWNCFGIIDGVLSNRKFRAQSMENAQRQFKKQYPLATLHTTTKIGK